MKGLVPRRDDFLFPLEQEFGKLFDSFWKDNPVKSLSGVGFPKMDVYEKDDTFTVTVSVPGLKSDDLEVEVMDNGVLTLRGRMSEEYRSPEGATQYIRELRQSAFERFVQLPDHVVGDPEAKMKDGMLTLTFKTKKQEPVSNVKRIAIKSE